MKFLTISASLILASVAVSTANAMPSVALEGVSASQATLVDYPCGPGRHMTLHGYCARYQYYAPPQRYGYYAPPPPPPPYYHYGYYAPPAPPQVGIYWGWGHRW